MVPPLETSRFRASWQIPSKTEFGDANLLFRLSGERYSFKRRFKE